MKNKILSFVAIVLITTTLSSLRAQTEADSTTIVSIQWEATSIYDGIVQKCAAIPMLFNGPQYISILEISPSKGVKANIAIADSITQTSIIAQSHNALAAINGSYFNMKQGNSVCYLRTGATVIDTTEVSEFKSRVTGAIYINKGKLYILPWSKQAEQKYNKKKGILLASGPLMLKNNKVCDWSGCEQSFIHTKHPRSAIATTTDGKILLITIDGRAPQYAQGMSIPELAYLIKLLGGNNALNLDGGGSTTLWHAGQIVNHPCDNKIFDHKGERKVPNIIYFNINSI